MTDLSTKAGVFVLFCSIVLGMALGLLYCVLSALRINASTKFFANFWDFLYCPLSAVIAYLFFIAALSGEIRIFAVIGIFFGFFMFYCYIGRKIRKVLVYVFGGLKKFMGVLMLPLTRLWGHIAKKQITQKYFKKLLKKAECVLYNIKAKSVTGGGEEDGRKEDKLEEKQNCFQ